MKSSFVFSFLKSFVINFISEVGDNTFITAVILAAKNSTLPVYLGTLLALSIMAIFSSIMCKLLDWLPYNTLQYLSIIVFIFYGVKLAIEGYGMQQDQAFKEYKEIKDKLSKISHGVTGYISPLSPSTTDDESVLQSSPTPNLPLYKRIKSLSPNDVMLKFSSSPEFNPFLAIACEAFALNFMAEFGDRSQISTIALGPQYNIYGIILGAILAYVICIGLAVNIGKWLVMKVSLKTITYVSAITYLTFALMSAYHVMTV